MLKTLRTRDLEVVVGFRYLEQGSVGNWTGGRIRISQWATTVTRASAALPSSDPMSGYVIIRSDVLRRLAPQLSAIGLKILVDLFITAPSALRCAELPYRFRARSVGTSKMDAKVCTGVP